MRFYLYLLLSAIPLLYGGCKNDIDLLSDYKSEIVCFGLLDPADSLHYIRISKVFLGAGNALVMAQQPDSIGFPIGTVDVKIERWNGGALVQTFQLYPDTTIPRDSGIFQNPYQVLYSGAFPVLTDGSKYKLSVTDLIKGTKLTAETSIVQDVVMINPPSNFMPLNMWDTTNIAFKCKTGVYGKRYNFKIRFHYTEQFVFDTTETSQHYVDWQIGGQDAASDAGNELMQFTVRRDNFLNMCALEIPSNIYVRRIAGNLDLIYTGAAQDFATYIDVGIANSSSAAALPPFTNTVGGYGLFSARTTTLLPGYWLDSDTRYQLRVNTVTQSLNFVR
jgi:hypothetical protein